MQLDNAKSPASEGEWVEPLVYRDVIYPGYAVSTLTGQVRGPDGEILQPDARGKILLKRRYGYNHRPFSAEMIAEQYAHAPPKHARNLRASEAPPPHWNDPKPVADEAPPAWNDPARRSNRAERPGELWRAVAEAPRYEVSDRGRVRGPSGHTLRMTEDISGDPVVNVKLPVEPPGGVEDGSPIPATTMRFRVADLVCAAFNGPRPFPEAEAHHFPDTDTFNCRADNVVWGPPRPKVSRRMASYIRELLAMRFYTVAEIAETLNVSVNAVQCQARKLAGWPDWPTGDEFYWRNHPPPELPPEQWQALPRQSEGSFHGWRQSNRGEVAHASWTERPEFTERKREPDGGEPPSEPSAMVQMRRNATRLLRRAGWSNLAAARKRPEGERREPSRVGEAGPRRGGVAERGARLPI